MTSVLTSLAAVVVALFGVMAIRWPRERPQALMRRGGGGDVERRGQASPGAARRRAGDLAGSTPDGSEIRIAMHESATTVLLFLTSTCAECAVLWRALSDGASRRQLAEAEAVVVTKDAASERPDRLQALAPPGIPVVMSTDAWDGYGVVAAPYAAVVRGDRAVVVAEGAIACWGDAVALCEAALVAP